MVIDYEKRESRKKYKAEYFQKNKEKIMAKRKLNPPSLDKIRQYSYKYNYGIDIGEVNALYIVLRGRCMICNVFMKDGDYKTMMVIDHDHSNGKIRGLLCRRCNSAIGLLDDRPEVMQNAIKYLQGGYI